jgi:hypothetical protein
MPKALRIFLSALLAAVALESVADGEHSPPPNYQGLWWNAPPGSEPGWGLGLVQHGDLIQAVWFTHDAGGNAHWLLLAASRTAGEAFAGDVLQATGPILFPFNPAWVTPRTVGTGTLHFGDANNGTLRYTVSGVQGVKLITRQLFGPPPTCGYEVAPELRAARNYTDLWGAAGGDDATWGLYLAHQGDVIFAAWFTCDFGGPRWFVATTRRVSEGVYTGKLLRTTGPALCGGRPDAECITCTEAGTATLRFAHGNAATFDYSLDGVTRTRTIARHSSVPPADTLCREAAGTTIRGKVFADGALRAVVCADTNGNARCDPAEARASTDAAGAYELAAPAGYFGALVAEVEGGALRMTSPARDYSAHITPFTTLVQLTKERDFRLAEEMVRNEIGLPPRFPIRLETLPAEGSLAQSVARGVAAGLASVAAALDYTSPEALGRTVAALPAALAEMPQLRIATKESAPIVSKEEYVEAKFTLTNPAAATPTAALNGRIRGRGNYTWALPKKPYKVQFTNDAAYAAVPDFLGMRKNRNWALLADHADRTLMRNQLMLTLGNSSLFADGLKWTPSGVHVEVWLNDDYQGVYLLTEDIRLDPARLDIRKMKATDVDGGCIVEVDYPLDCYNDGVLSLQHITPRGVRLCLKTPDEKSITAAQLKYIKGLIDAAEGELYANARADGLNLLSFADWYLLQELYRNYDAPFYSSDYLWKDTGAAAIPSDRLLNMGPLWDFDLGAGNLPLADAWRPQGCWVTKTREGMTNWFAKAFDNRELLDITLARWKDKRAALGKLIDASITAFARRLEPAQQRNFARWPVLGVANEYHILRTYREHVDFLRFFLAQRMAWLDLAWRDPASFEAMCK